MRCQWHGESRRQSQGTNGGIGARSTGAEYNHKNQYWFAWCLKDLIASGNDEDRERFEARTARLQIEYDEMAAIYQRNKDSGAKIYLK